MALAFMHGELRDAFDARTSPLDSMDLSGVVDAVRWTLRMVFIATTGLLAWAVALTLRPSARRWMVGLRRLPGLGDYSIEARKPRFLELQAILAWFAAVTASVSAVTVIVMTPVLADALFAVLDLPLNTPSIQ
ncbi:hypothetical protein [Candidatus Poriferisodalis sp.]|uniref:hypothetical protein n=1 Tax=Candidatus Poriferisodalis sp. TaxID=3101277 RepID=UPI003B02A92C